MKAAVDKAKADIATAISSVEALMVRIDEDAEKNRLQRASAKSCAISLEKAAWNVQAIGEIEATRQQD